MTPRIGIKCTYVHTYTTYTYVHMYVHCTSYTRVNMYSGNVMVHGVCMCKHMYVIHKCINPRNHVHCTSYILRSIVYEIGVYTYIIQCTVYSVRCIVYDMHCTSYNYVSSSRWALELVSIVL